MNSELPSGRGYHWSADQRRVADDAVLDAVEAVKLAEAEAQLRDDRLRDVSGVERHSAARPGRLISEAEGHLWEVVDWLDDLIDRKFGPDTD